MRRGLNRDRLQNLSGRRPACDGCKQHRFVSLSADRATNPADHREDQQSHDATGHCQPSWQSPVPGGPETRSDAKPSAGLGCPHPPDEAHQRGLSSAAVADLIQHVDHQAGHQFVAELLREALSERSHHVEDLPPLNCGFAQSTLNPLHLERLAPGLLVGEQLAQCGRFLVAKGDLSL